MAAREETPHGRARLAWLDNLRTAMIFLVVVFHCGLVYETSGVAGFFWIVFDFSGHPLASLPNLAVIDIFVMSTVFFISGYLTLPSLRRTRGRDFLAGKARRLLAPWLIACLTLIPLYKVIFLYSRGMPQQAWTSYFPWSNGAISQNWLWFLPVLFLFDAVFLLLSRSRLKWPSLSVPQAVTAVFAIGLAWSVAMNMAGLEGWTKTPLLDFQNERLLIYFLMFGLGAFCYQRGVLAGPWQRSILFPAVLATVWIPVAVYRHFYILRMSGSDAVVVAPLADTLLAWTAFHLALFGLVYLSVQVSRRWMDGGSPLSRELGANTYSVYIVHTVVLGGIALLLVDSGLPAVLRFPVLALSTYAASTVLVSVYRRLLKPQLRGLGLSAT